MFLLPFSIVFFKKHFFLIYIFKVENLELQYVTSHPCAYLLQPRNRVVNIKEPKLWLEPKLRGPEQITARNENYKYLALRLEC